MLATIAGDILTLFFGLGAFVLGLAFWFIRIIAELRERITRLETKLEDRRDPSLTTYQKLE